jgi:hypothetical protein
VNSPRRHLCGINLNYSDEAGINMLLERESEPFRSSEHGAKAFVERKVEYAFAPFGSGNGITERNGGFADPGTSDQQRTRPSRDAAANECVELGASAACIVSDKWLVMFRSNKARKDRKSAALYPKVVIAASERDTSHFHHVETAALGAVVEHLLFQLDDTMGDAMQLKVVVL